MDEIVLIASAGDQTIYAVELLTGSILQTHRGNCTVSNMAIIGSTINGSGDYVVAGHDGKASISIWQLGKDQILYRCAMPEPMGVVESTSDGRFIVAAGAKSGRMYLWDAPTGSLIRFWDAHYKAVSTIAVSGDDALIVTGGEDGLVCAWAFVTLLDDCASLGHITASQDGGGRDKRITAVHTWTDHTLPVTKVICSGSAAGGVPSGAGSRVSSSSRDGSVCVYDIASGQRLFRAMFPSPITSISTDGLEHRLFAGGENGQIYILDLIASASRLTGHSTNFSNRTDMNYMGDMERNEATISFMHRNPPSVSKDAYNTANVQMAEQHEKAISALLCVQSSRASSPWLLISASLDGEVKIWDPASRQALSSLSIAKISVTALVRVPCGSFLHQRSVASTLRSEPSHSIGNSISSALGPRKDKMRLPLAPLKKYGISSSSVPLNETAKAIGYSGTSESSASVSDGGNYREQAVCALDDDASENVNML